MKNARRAKLHIRRLEEGSEPRPPGPAPDAVPLPPVEPQTAALMAVVERLHPQRRRSTRPRGGELQYLNIIIVLIVVLFVAQTCD